MDIKNTTRDLGNSVENTYHTVATHIKNFNYKREVLIGIAIAILGSLIFLAYKWYDIRQSRKAQVTLSALITDYDTQLNASESNWSAVVQQAQTAYEAGQTSVMAPYFLLFEVDALVQQNKKNEAVEVMEKALNKLKGSSLFTLFSTKYALMLLDMPDNALQEKGRELLIKNAQDSSNRYRDYALYYLGQYYFLHDQKADAKIAWQELIDSQRIEQVAPSAWGQLAEQKMAHII